jgi:hypothetical protein
MRQVFELNFIRCFVHQNGGKKYFSNSRKWLLVFYSIALLMELFVNYSELNDRAGKTASGLINVT